MRITALLSLILIASSAPSFAEEKTQPNNSREKEEILELSPLVVTGNGRGIMPINARFRMSPLSGNLKSDLAITSSMHGEKSLQDYGLEKQEQIVAINGKRVIGMDCKDLKAFWFEGGDAGEEVKLTIRGTGKNGSTYRAVILKRVSLQRLKESVKQHAKKQIQ